MVQDFDFNDHISTLRRDLCFGPKQILTMYQIELFVIPHLPRHHDIFGGKIDYRVSRGQTLLHIIQILWFSLVVVRVILAQIFQER